MKGSWIFAPFGRKKTEGLYPRPVTAFTPNFDSKSKSVRGAGAPSPPSEEGGGCLHKGFEQADGGRDTPSMCESSRYSRQKKQMSAFSLGARLHLGANSDLALSLPQSSPQKLKGLTAPSSEGAEAAPPQSTDLALLSKFGVNAVTGRRYNPSVFSACKPSRKSSSPYTGEPRFALRLTQ